MKKTVFAAILAAIAINASAQNVSDALRFSLNDYYGTARSVAMGNAFTALGGDLGSVQLNPAGSAVNSYSQVTITPSLNILSGSALYSALGRVEDGATTTRFNNNSRLTMPNIGVMLNYKTHRKSGIRSVSFGIVGNATSYYNDYMSAGGLNDRSSYMGYLSAFASGNQLTAAEIGKAGYQEMSPVFWPSMVGYRCGMVNDAGDGSYMSPAEGYKDGAYVLRGALRQNYERASKGSKYDMVMNFGLNFNDRIFIGGNLGIVDIDYAINSYIREEAVDHADFPVTISGKPDYFTSMRFHQAYSASGSGVYAKIGIIAVPVTGLRIGAAVQTPTANYITERLWFSGDTDFASGAKGSETIYDDEDYIYSYKLISPARYSAGIAYTIPGFGLFSADYELADYSSMSFRGAEYSDSDSFSDSNKSIRDGAGASHMIRAGLEYTPTKSLALRAGYNFTSTAERYIDSHDNKVAPEHAGRQAVSLGVGYKSAGSFFCDAAARLTMLPHEYVYPYDSYDDIMSPEIRVSNNLWNLMLTFGWRF